MLRTSEIVAASGTNAAPTAATDGVTIPPGTNRALIAVSSTGGSGTMSVTLRAWGYLNETGKWYPLGTGAGAGDTANTQGWLNDGAKIEEIAADTIRHSEVIDHLDCYNRLDVQIVATEGTTPTFDIDAFWYRPHLRVS